VSERAAVERAQSVAAQVDVRVRRVLVGPSSHKRIPHLNLTHTSSLADCQGPGRFRTPSITFY